MSDRIEKLRKARSLNEVSAILRDIALSITKLGRQAKNMAVALSAADTELTIDRSGTGAKIRTPSGRSKRAATISQIKLEKFVAPKVTEIKKHNDVLSALFENERELKTALAVVQQGFQGVKHKDTALRAIQALQKEVDASLSIAFEALNHIAEQHVPSEIRKVGDHIQTFLQEHLDSTRYKEIADYVYVGTGEKGQFIFSFYIGIDGLKTSKGFTFDTFFIVLTGVVKAGVLTMYVNSTSDFRAPGKYPVGYPVESLKKATQHVAEFLAQNDVQVETERQVFPVSTDRLHTAGLNKISGVEKLGVKDDALWITLKGTPSQTVVSNTIKDVMARLHSLLNLGRRKSALSYQLVKRSGKTMLQFILLNKGGSKKLNRDVVADLQSIFGLSDKQVQYLREAQRAED